MKKIYIVPEIKVTPVLTESMLAGASGSGYHFPELETKGHNSFWDSSFWGDEETEKPMFQQPKSLWDD